MARWFLNALSTCFLLRQRDSALSHDAPASSCSVVCCAQRGSGLRNIARVFDQWRGAFCPLWSHGGISLVGSGGCLCLAGCDRVLGLVAQRHWAANLVGYAVVVVAKKSWITTSKLRNRFSDGFSDFRACAPARQSSFWFDAVAVDRLWDRKPESVDRVASRLGCKHRGRTSYTYSEIGDLDLRC